jgi:hypothetical protein
MNAMQLSLRQPIVDRLPTQASLSKLASRRHAVLSGGNSSHLFVGRVAFCTHVEL